jgi:hypothetical protein
MLRDEIFPEESWDDSFLDYREMMFENYEYISKYRVEFIKDDSISTSFKLERITEILDFFLLEEDYEKCDKLKKIKEALEVRMFFSCQ